MTVIDQPIQLIDGYKLGHRQQYPEGTQYVFSNFTPRGSRIDGVTHVVFFGLQAFLLEYNHIMHRDFFSQDIDEICAKYEADNLAYLGPNDVGSDHIRALHELGYLPLRFKALPEGSLVPLRVPVFTVENTHPDFFWLVNYIESDLSAAIWQPITSATIAYEFKNVLTSYAHFTGAPVEFVNFQGHDFSYRGMGGRESAKVSGAAHLTSFLGTDSIPSINWIKQYYGTELPEDFMIGVSVPATEHSVMCAGGEDSELDTYKRLLKLYPQGIVSVVSDTWDYWGVLTEILPQIKDEILSREGKLVIRPDSGDPVKIICGDPEAPEGTPEHKGTVELLWDLFGGTETENGYRVLDEHIGCIYGDSITQERADWILAGLANKNFASCNVVFGIGSFTYQYNTRDTFGMAMKATWVQINGEGRNIFKAPKTDNGLKLSAKGRLAVHYDDTIGDYVLINEATPEQEAASELKTVFEDGAGYNYQNFADIRERLASYDN